MSINIIFSLTEGGSPLTSTVDHGNAANGDSTTAKTVFLRHDGASEITSVGLYLRQYSGTYSGTRSSAADFSEIIGWGDESASDDFGGFQVNYNATGLGGGGSFRSSSWPIYSDKSVSVSGSTVGFVHRTGVGDSEGNAVTLPVTTGASSAGVIPAGSSPGVRFQSRIVVPVNEDQIGIRQFDQILRFSFTS